MMASEGHRPRMTSQGILAAAVLALALAGCTTSGYGPDFGYLELTSFQATATFDALTGMAHVEILGAIRAEGAEGVRVEMYVVDRPCAMGPEGDPNGWLAHQTQRPGDPDAGKNETRQYGASFDVRVGPGQEYAALATTHADNTIGPIFGSCKTFRAVA